MLRRQPLAICSFRDCLDKETGDGCLIQRNSERMFVLVWFSERVLECDSDGALDFLKRDAVFSLENRSLIARSYRNLHKDLEVLSDESHKKVHGEEWTNENVSHSSFFVARTTWRRGCQELSNERIPGDSWMVRSFLNLARVLEHDSRLRIQ